MKKALNAFAVMLTLFAVIGLATPVFACGGGKDKEGTTASKTDKQESEKDSEKPESDDSENKKNETDTPTKS
jgi:hypothetical protein